jgi:hypothetical protein
VVVGALRADGRHADLDNPAPAEPADRAGATTELLFQLRRALATDAPARLAQLADPDLPSAAHELEDLADNVRELRVDHLDLRYLDDAPLELSAAERNRFGPDAWISEVQLSWRFRGVDSAVSTLEVPLVADWDGDRAVFASSRTTGDYQVPLWFTEALSVRRSRDTLVLAGEARAARSLGAQARTAVEVVRRTLPGWRGPLVIEAPASGADFRSAAGMSRAASRAIAAVTNTTDGSTVGGAPVHVFLNPGVFDPLGPQGRQIVLSHEATHVALGAATADMPLWLSEGMADYVALVDNPLPATVLAAQIRRLVQEKGAPKALPGPREFAGSNRDIGAWYEAAWLAVRLIAETHGRRALLAFYAAAEEDGDTRAAFRQVLGTTELQFRRAWQARLVELAD